MDFDFDNDFEDAINKFLRFLEEMEQKGLIERDGDKRDKYGYPIYRVTKNGRNKIMDLELRFAGRNN